MKNRFLQHLSLMLYVWLLTMPLLAIFLREAPSGELLSTVYQVSTAGYFGVFVLLACVLTLPLSLTRWTAWLAAFLAWLWLLFLSIDLAVFQLYKFHLDGLLIQMFFADFAGVGVPWPILAVALVFAIALLWFTFWLHRLVLPSGATRVGILLISLFCCLTLFTVNSVTNIWATYYNREEITVYRPYLPIYFPVESEKKAPQVSAWWPDVFPAKHGEPNEALANQQGFATYPAANPVCVPKKNKPSILMVVLESWQADALNPVVMPNLSQLAQTSTRFEKHLSSGSTTVPGLFGLLHGLHPNYYDLFKATPNRYPSLLTETLNDQGYESQVFTSSKLDRFALRSLFFSKVKPSNYFDAEDDKALVERLVKSLKTRPANQPYFDFVFLTSSHSPYLYPPEAMKFTPIPVIQGGFALNYEADPTKYKNHYHNSLAYEDTLVAHILAALASRPELANTWIVVTGDHAEEFNENGLGYWGHGSNYSRWQVQTPMLVKAPRQTKGAVEKRLSTHQDVVPTLMKEALGCDSPIENFSNGENMFSLSEGRSTVVASYKSTAYVIDGTVIDKMTRKKYDFNDMNQVRAMPEPVRVNALMKEERRFMSATEGVTRQ